MIILFYTPNPHFYQSFLYNRKSAMDVFEKPRFTVAVCNGQDEPVEAVQTIDSPALVKKDSIWWGYTFYMQTPLENIGNDFSIIIRLLHGPAGTTPSVVPTCKYRIEKAVIDSGHVKFNFISSPGGESVKAGGEKETTPRTDDNISGTLRRMTMANRKTSSSTATNVEIFDSCLEGEIEITKFYRDIDLEKLPTV
jgi:hypothetical protein